jgi:predicted Ser/Thr protein kinase
LAPASDTAAAPPPEPRYLSRGYQGVVYVTGEGADQRVIKLPLGWGPTRSLRLWMIRREYRAYQQLAGVAGVPRCFGLSSAGALELEFIAGEPFHEAAAALRDRPQFFAQLLTLILRLHAAGVAHADLKRKGNLLITPDGRPVLLDFGAAFLRQPGGGAWNRWFFRQASRMDLNAWVKLKYRRRYTEVSPEDQGYYRPTTLEAVARVLRRTWWRLTGRQWRKALRRRRDS